MTMHIGKKNLISFFLEVAVPASTLRSALGAVFPLTSYSQLASGLSTGQKVTKADSGENNARYVDM